MRVLIANDHELVRRGIRSLLVSYPGVDICGEAVDGQAAIELSGRVKPDLILMAIGLPRVNGLDATREIRRILPQTEILIVAQHDSPLMMQQALRAGARGYLVTSALETQLAAGIEKVSRGEAFFDDAVLAGFENRDVQGSPRTEEAVEALSRHEHRPRDQAENPNAPMQSRTAEGEWRRAERRKRPEHILDLSALLLEAQDNERRRIARELHDSAGQILAALSLNLDTIAILAPQNPERAIRTIKDSQGLVQQLTQEIRTMSYLLYPPMLDQSGLADALRWYVQGLRDRSPMTIDLEIPPDFKRPDPALELVIFRVVQEALTNIHRHSGSKTATIRLAHDGTTVSLEVEDSGKGIPAERLAEIQSHGSGVGIRGMRERVRLVNGEIKIESSGGGTRISAVFPVSEGSPVEETGQARPG